MSKKEHKGSDAPLNDYEVKDIISKFKEKYQMQKYQVPIHYSFRADIRFKRNVQKEGIVVLTPHYVGLFGPKKNKEKGCELLEKGLIPILNICQVYFRTNVFACLMLDDQCQDKAILKSPRSTRFAQLLYRNYRFSFDGKKSNKDIDDFFKSDLKDTLPPIKFESDVPNFNKKTKGDHKCIVVSPSQKFQFSYFANCARSDNPSSFNQEVVRYVHNLILSDNSIINVSQLPLELSFGMTSKGKSSGKNGKGAFDNDDSDGGNESDDDKDETDDDKNVTDDENNDQNEDENDNQNNQDDDQDGNQEGNQNDDQDEDGNGNKNDDEQKTGNKHKMKKGHKHKKHKSKTNNEKSENIGGVNLSDLFISLNNTNFIAGVTAVKTHKPRILRSLADLISLDQKLRIIHFEKCDIEGSLHKISKEISKTKEFKVAYWNLSNNKGLNFKYFPEIISKSTYPIYYLNLSKCNINAEISNEIFKKLSESEHLNELQFLLYSKNDFNSPECISSFRTLMDKISNNDSSLKYVDFSSLKESKEFADVLDVLKDHSSIPIETLIFKGFDSGDERVPLDNLKSIIRKSKYLQKLDISKMKIKNDNYEQLFEIINSIVENSDLSDFNLCLNNLNLNGEKIVILFRSFLTNAKSKSGKGDSTKSQILKTSRKGKISEVETEHLGLSKWKSLSFNNNGMTSSDLYNLISLFQRMKNLEELSFNDNFNDNNSDIVDNLENLLNMSQSKRSSANSFPKIKKLSIAGTPKDKPRKNYLKKYLNEFLTRVSDKYSDQIVYLDVSNNHAGDKIVGPLKNLLHSENTVIETLIFDGNDISQTSYLKELGEKAKDCKTLITFPFPKDDALNIIKKIPGNKSAIIEELSEVQISFIKATNAHRKALNLPEELPFTHDESVKLLIQKIIKEAKKEEGNGPKDYLRHHTKFCKSLGLPFPQDKMGKVILDDEVYKDTVIGSMRIYESKDDDAPEFNKNKNGESDDIQLAKWYLEREGEEEEEEEEEEEDKGEEESKKEESKKEEESNNEEKKEDKTVLPPPKQSSEEESEKDDKAKPSNKKSSIKNKGKGGKRPVSDSEEESEKDGKAKSSNKKNSIKNKGRGGKKSGESDSEEEESKKGYKAKSSNKKNSIKNKGKGGKKSGESDSEEEEESEKGYKAKSSNKKNSIKNKSRGSKRPVSDSDDSEDNKTVSKRKISNRKQGARRPVSDDSEEETDNEIYKKGRRPSSKNAQRDRRRKSQRLDSSDEEDRQTSSKRTKPNSTRYGKRRKDESESTSETDSEEIKKQKKRPSNTASKRSSRLAKRNIRESDESEEESESFNSNPRKSKNRLSSSSRNRNSSSKKRSTRSNRDGSSSNDRVDIDSSSGNGKSLSHKKNTKRSTSSKRVKESSSDSIELERLYTRFNEPSDEDMSTSSAKQSKNSKPNRRGAKK